MPIPIEDIAAQLQLIKDYLRQGQRVNGAAYIDQAATKNSLRNLVTHRDFRQRQTIDEAFTDADPGAYFELINEVLNIIDEFSGDYEDIALTEEENAQLISLVENRITNYFGADIP